MKKVLIMVSCILFPRLLVAQAFDVNDLLGDNWYGLYLNGEKAGFSVNSTKKDDAGNLIMIEDAKFRMNMAGTKQDMHVYSCRTYSPDGALASIVSTITDPAGTSEFNARVEGDSLILKSTIGGVVNERRLPKPQESLVDALKYAKWVREKPQLGDELTFSIFEPMYRQEVAGLSTIVGIEERIFEGVPTKVYKIKTRLDLMGVETVSYVAENSTTLEDVIGEIITMRLEPEAVAKDVNYNNDVIVSNAAIVETPIDNPRTRQTLRLLLRGPLSSNHLFNDQRQFIESAGDHFTFVANQVSLEGFTPARLPIQDEEVQRWLGSTEFVQSDHPQLIEKAKEIIGEETDTYVISSKLCEWVHKNMRSTYSARLTNALEVLTSLTGDCTEHSILFIGLARAIGLPAREVAGLVYVPGAQSGFYFHQWAKVWIGKWIDVDPTFNQPLADVTHIKLAEGDLFEQAKLIPIIGRLKIEVLPDDASSAPQTPPAAKAEAAQPAEPPVPATPAAPAAPAPTPPTPPPAGPVMPPPADPPAAAAPVETPSPPPTATTAS